MALEDLTERERQVFISIIQSFIDTAEPVGSRYLAKHCDLNISPATIRNVMTDLEEKGLITQPHTSAGRKPTDIGYRQYVDSLINVSNLNGSEKRMIMEQLTRFSEDVDQIVEKASNVLSQISHQLGVILAPRFSKGKLKKIELVSLSENKLLVILSIKSGLVKTVIVEIDGAVPRNLLEATAAILNERLYNLSIEELVKSFDDRFRDLDNASRNILQSIKVKSDKLVSYNSLGDFYVAGAKNVIEQPEFATKEEVGTILDIIDRRDLLLRVLTENEADGISIVIGDENKDELMKNCSLITTTYRYEDAMGTIGVIGPTRMPYVKIISLVKFMAETLGYLIAKKQK